MEMIGNLWWLWLVLVIMSYSVVPLNQLSRMKSIMEGDLNFSRFGKGFGTMIVFGYLGAVFLVLLGISVVVNMIEYIR